MTQFPLQDEEFTKETRVYSPSHFLIRIESFSLLTKYGINTYESRSFDAGGYKWKLIINFEGNDVSVYFSIAESDSLKVGWEVNAIFTFFIHNQLLDYYHCFRGMARRFNAVNPKWGFSKLISNKSLMDPNKGYVVDDSCVYGAEVFVIKAQRVNECLSLIKNASSYKRDWKIPKFSKLGNVWNSEEFVVGDHNWKVNLYPKGNGSRAKDRYMSIYVECVDSKKFGPHKKVKAEGFLRIKSNIKDSHHSKKFGRTWLSSTCHTRGFSEFLPIADMSSGGFLVDDCCFLEVEITVQALGLDAPKI